MATARTTARGPRPQLGTGLEERRLLNGNRKQNPPRQFGTPGRSFSRTTPFFIGLTGALGVAVAYLMVRALADVTQILAIIGISLFLGVGLQPAVEWLGRRGFHRPVAVTVITVAFLAVIGGFVVAAVPPITHEAHELMANFPRYRRDVASGKGWLGQIVAKLHLSSYVRPNSPEREED